ncbi:MAG: hypothetical protein CVV44_16505 [Spirochaetae bacterium HGW-Spirochaetae-1]|jgi:ferredoxin|nr:MAG: hypothetical protein CVV44_16505 [Spirochaetae bacterium HGW-Spirochaetae-1]
MKKHGWRWDKAIHNYLYFKFYYPYVSILSKIFIPLGYLTWFKPLKYAGNFVFNRYHSKVLSSEDTTKIFTLNEDINLVSDENKKIVPYKYAHKILFKDHEFIVVMDCPCKKTFNAPKEKINSCFVVGSGTGKFWLDSCQKYNPRQVKREEALQIIKDFRKEGYITQAFFKVATGGSTGVICTCHPDYCVSLRASKLTRKIHPDTTMTMKSGYSVKWDEKKCKKCGTCIKTCNFGNIKLDKNGRIYDQKECMGCELCVEHCPNGALTLFIDKAKPLPLDMDYVKVKIKETELKN